MNNLLDLLREKRVVNRVVGLFSSYGWSGGAVKGMKQLVEDNKLDLIEPIVDARFCATPEQLEQCQALGRAMAARIRVGAAQESSER